MGLQDMPFIEGTMWAEADMLGRYNEDTEAEERDKMAKVVRKLPAGTKLKKRGKSEDAPVAGTEDLSLPTEKSVPSDNIWDYSILLFGEKKIGKTDLSAQAPKTFHLMFEPGGKAQSILQRPVPTWRAFKQYVKLLKKDKTFRTVAVDTVDLAYTRCFEYVCQKLGIEHPSDSEYGKGWAAVRAEFLTEMATLMSMGKGVIFISHAVDKEIKTKDGGKYDKIMPTLAGQGRDIIEGMVDLWFYYGYDGEARVLTITGSDHIGAGHRLKHNFRYPDGSPIREISMGSNAEEGYANLLAAFKNTLPKPASAIDPDAPRKLVIKKKLKKR